ncbi:MAG: CaiB/BaiF CoA transferase family protein [Pseudomonadota bacterium]|jgi:CoA:oxalate CoA-transferase|nr:CoA transferase [Alphaproteobacteria bacterium]
MGYSAPYKDIKVIDLTHALAGPYAASLLARYGANVIKVEPGRGDLSRTIGKTYPSGHTLLSVLANLGKRSISVELKTDGGREVLRRLLKDADIFIESFRPSVIKRLGFDYEAVRQINPRIIYLSVSGFGQKGPFAERPGTDGVLQAFSGFISDNKGTNGVPHRSQVFLMDMAAGLYNLQALQAALWARQSETVGCYLNNSLLETAAALQNLNIASRILEMSERAEPLAFPYAIFQTRDGNVSTGVLFDREFKPFMEMLNLPELGGDQRLSTTKGRFEHRQLIEGPIRDAVAKLTTDEFCAGLIKLRMLHERINTYLDFAHHEQTRQMNALCWHDYPGIGNIPLANVPGTARLEENSHLRKAPMVGEHTGEVLSEHGYSPEEISALTAQGAIDMRESAAA